MFSKFRKGMPKLDFSCDDLEEAFVVLCSSNLLCSFSLAF